MSVHFPHHEDLLTALPHSGSLTSCKICQEKLEDVSKGDGHDEKGDTITNAKGICSVSFLFEGLQ